MKKITILLLGLLLVLFSSIGVSASGMEMRNSSAAVSAMAMADYFVWRIYDALQDYTTSYGSYVFFYEGSPAEASGEVDTVNSEKSVVHTFSGTIAAGLRHDIEIELGYQFEKAVALSASKQSRTLNEGEYVRGYWRPIYSQSRVIQREYHHLDGYEVPTGNTKACYGKEAVGIGLRLEYYSTSGLKVNTEYFQIFKQCLKAIGPLRSYCFPFPLSSIR